MVEELVPPQEIQRLPQARFLQQTQRLPQALLLPLTSHRLELLLPLTSHRLELLLPLTLHLPLHHLHKWSVSSTGSFTLSRVPFATLNQ
jgi:hypothetical protein